ncbi:unnamed protein product [Bathycoccus prasinos]
MATTLCSRATTMTTPSSSFTISSLSTTRLNRRICERNQDLLLSRQRRRQKRCFFSFDAKSAATTPPGSDDEVEFNIDADSIAKRVFREKNNENNNSINVKEGTVYTLGTNGRFHIKYTKNKYKEQIDFMDSSFKTPLLGGFNEDEETLTNGQHYYSYESELSGTIRKNHLDGCEKNVLNTFVARTGQWATAEGVNKMLRGKVVGVCETSSADAVARYSMKPPPLTWTKKKKKRKNDDDDVNDDVMILPPNMPKGKTRTAVVALAFAIKPKIAMRAFVNLDTFTVWRAELITPEGVELWRFSNGEGEGEVAHREHAAGHVTVYTTTEERCARSSDEDDNDDDDSFEAPYYGALESETQTSTSKTTSIDVMRCEGGHFLAETSRGYFFVDFSSHVSGIDKTAAALSANEDLKICGYTSSLGVGGAPIRGNIRIGDFDALGSTQKKVAFWEQSLDAAARLPGTLMSPPAGSLGLDAIRDTIIRLNVPKRVPGSRKNPKVTLDAFASEEDLLAASSSKSSDDDFVLPWSKLTFIDGAPYVECFLNPDDSMVKTVNSKSGLYKLSLAVGGVGVILSNRVATELDLIEQKQGLSPGGILSGAGEDTGRLARVSNKTFTIRADSFRIGRFGFKHETVRALTHLDGDPPDLGLSCHADGIVCADLFRGCCLYIDAKNERMAVTSAIQ